MSDIIETQKKLLEIMEKKTISEIRLPILKVLQSSVIEENLNLTTEITYFFTKHYLESDCEDETLFPQIQSIILEFMENIKNLKCASSYVISSIIEGFTRACLEASKSFDEIKGVLLDFADKLEPTDENNDYLYFIISSFFDTYLSQTTLKASEIEYTISNILKLDTVKKDQRFISDIIDSLSEIKRPINEVSSIISNILKLDTIKEDRQLITNIISDFIVFCLDNEELQSDQEKLKQLILNFIKENIELTTEITYFFTKHCLESDCEYETLFPQIQSIILEFMENTKNLGYSSSYVISYITAGFTRACLEANESFDKIKDVLLEFADKLEPTDENNDYLYFIISPFFDTYLSQTTLKASEIEYAISNILKLDTVKKDQRFISDIIDSLSEIKRPINEVSSIISNILKLDTIKEDRQLITNIISDFIVFCLDNEELQSDQEKLKQLILNFIKENIELTTEITYFFTKHCLESDCEDETLFPQIQPIILEFMENIKNLGYLSSYVISYITKGFTRACLEANESFDKIKDVLLDFASKNTFILLVDNIIKGFIQSCLESDYKDKIEIPSQIQSIILEFMQRKTDSVYQYSIIKGLTEVYLAAGREDIQSVILRLLQLDIVKLNPNLTVNIIEGFIYGYSFEKLISETQPLIISAILELEAIKQDPKFIFEIINNFTRICLTFSKPIKDRVNGNEDIQSVILYLLQLNIVKLNPDLVSAIIKGFTSGCLDKNQTFSDIQSVISEAIRQNPNLDSAIINGYAWAYLLSKNKFEELVPVFQNLLEEVQKSEFSVKNKTLTLLINQIKSFSIPTLSQYLQETLFTLKDESSLSKKDRDISAENKLLGLFKSLYSEVFGDIDKFEDVKLKDLIPIWQMYFVSKIKIQTIEGGYFKEVLPFIFDIFKDKDLTIGQLFTDIKPLLQNFYYINLYSKEGKEQLKKIKEESEKPENKDKPFIVYTDFPEHSVVSIIQNGQISIIDSSHAIFHPDYPQYQQILIDCGFKDTNIRYFNAIPYQENGTCYLDATLAFKHIMEEFLSQQKDKKPENMLTTLISVPLGPQVKTAPDRIVQTQQTQNTRLLVNMVLEATKFYQILQQPVDPKYLTLPDTSKKTSDVSMEDKEGFAPTSAIRASSRASEEGLSGRATKEFQEQLTLDKIKRKELPIMPEAIAAIIVNTSTVSQLAAEFAIISRIFGAIPEVRENVEAIQIDQQKAAKLQPTATLQGRA